MEQFLLLLLKLADGSKSSIIFYLWIVTMAFIISAHSIIKMIINLINKVIDHIHLRSQARMKWHMIRSFDRIISHMLGKKTLIVTDYVVASEIIKICHDTVFTINNEEDKYYESGNSQPDKSTQSVSEKTE